MKVKPLINRLKSWKLSETTLRNLKVVSVNANTVLVYLFEVVCTLLIVIYAVRFLFADDLNEIFEVSLRIVLLLGFVMLSSWYASISKRANSSGQNHKGGAG